MMPMLEGFVAERNIVAGLVRLIGFAIVSATGLAIDFAVFLTLAAAGVPLFLANLVSATTATVFVFLVSTIKVFQAAPTPRTFWPALVAYLVWQTLSINAASLAVAYLAAYLGAVEAKLAILPFTFGSNYIVVRFLASRMRCETSRPLPGYLAEQ
jgi:putative flippase GtrA